MSRPSNAPRNEELLTSTRVIALPGGLELHLPRCELSHASQPTNKRPIGVRLADIAYTLMTRDGTVPVEDLASDNTLAANDARLVSAIRVYVSKLRQVIQELGAPYQISNVREAGYRLVYLGMSAETVRPTPSLAHDAIPNVPEHVSPTVIIQDPPPRWIETPLLPRPAPVFHPPQPPQPELAVSDTPLIPDPAVAAVEGERITLSLTKEGFDFLANHLFLTMSKANRAKYGLNLLT